MVFEKLHKFIGKNIKALVSQGDQPCCLRLQKNRVFYVREDVMRRATNVRLQIVAARTWQGLGQKRAAATAALFGFAAPCGAWQPAVQAGHWLCDLSCTAVGSNAPSRLAACDSCASGAALPVASWSRPAPASRASHALQKPGWPDRFCAAPGPPSPLRWPVTSLSRWAPASASSRTLASSV